MLYLRSFKVANLDLMDILVKIFFSPPLFANIFFSFQSIITLTILFGLMILENPWPTLLISSMTCMGKLMIFWFKKKKLDWALKRFKQHSSVISSKKAFNYQIGWVTLLIGLVNDARVYLIKFPEFSSIHFTVPFC